MRRMERVSWMLVPSTADTSMKKRLWRVASASASFTDTTRSAWRSVLHPISMVKLSGAALLTCWYHTELAAAKES